MFHTLLTKVEERDTYWYDSIRIQSLDIVGIYALLHRLHPCASSSIPFVQTGSEIKLSMMVTITVNSSGRSRAAHFSGVSNCRSTLGHRNPKVGHKNNVLDRRGSREGPRV